MSNSRIKDKALIFFDKLYEKMSETEKRAFYEKLIKEVQVYEERQLNGQLQCPKDKEDAIVEALKVFKMI